MDEKFTLADIRQSAYKNKDAWWTVYLVDPFASRLILPIANYTNMTPNQLTMLAFLLGLLAAYQFSLGTNSALIFGALLYHLSFICDCMDGKIARLKGTGSMFGAWLDYILDRTRVAICAFVLMFTQFQLTGDVTFLYFGALIGLLDGIRYMTSLLVYKLNNEMKKNLKKAKAELKKEMKENRQNKAMVRKVMKSQVNYLYQIPKYRLSRWMDTISVRISEKKLRLQERSTREIDIRFPSYQKIRSFFLKRRVRLHLFSGIEYQMFIFILGPISGFLIEIVIVSSILIFLFECLIVYKLWLNTIDYKRRLAKINNQRKALQ